jgi:hypothetical protein
VEKEKQTYNKKKEEKIIWQSYRNSPRKRG